MKKMLILLIIIIFNSFLLSECNNLLPPDCTGNCEWVEDLEYGNCNNLSGSDCTQVSDCSWTSYQQACTGGAPSDCTQPGCGYSWLEYTCTGSYTVSNCSGGDYEIDNGYCQEIEFLECSENLSESVCNNGDNCEWIESYSYENCGSLSVSACYNYPGECYVDSQPGWYDSSGPYCTGGTYEIDNSYCTEALDVECSDMIEVECNNDDECNWIEDIEYGNCSNYNNGTACDANEECYWDLCYGGYYGSWSHCCRGGSFEVDNSYCTDTLIVECSDMIEAECSTDDSCNWVENTETGSCSSLSLSVCDLSEYGSCYSDCTNWGNYYNGMFCYGTMYCTGGSYQIDNNYCEDLQFIQGDINQDLEINVSDVIITLNLILAQLPYNYLADMNDDNMINIQDVIMIVQIILNG